MSLTPKSLDFPRPDFNAAEHPISFARRTNAHGLMVIGDDAELSVRRLQSGSVVIDIDGNGGHADIELSEAAADLLCTRLGELEAQS